MFEFLSEEWFEAAHDLRARYQDQLPEISLVVRLNQVITDVPFGDGVVHAYIDTSDGAIQLERGALDDPDVTLMVDYATAKALIVDQDPTVVMQAMLAGKVTIQGDMMKLMAMQGAMAASSDGEGAELAAELADELRAITADVDDFTDVSDVTDGVPADDDA